MPIYHSFVLSYAEELFGDFSSIELGYFMIPKVSSESGIFTWNLSDHEFSSAMQCVEMATQNIVNSNFEPQFNRPPFDPLDALYLNLKDFKF